jgi:hypothetical protein
MKFLHSHRQDLSPTFIAGLVMLMIASLLLGVTLYLQHKQPQTLLQTPFKIGQVVTLGSATFKINGVSYSDGKPGFPAPASQHYLILDVSVTNISEKPINIFPASDMYLKRSTGEVAYLTPFALDQPFRAGELSPGEAIRGEISYVTPKDSTFKFYVDSIYSGGVVPFALQ